MRIHLLGICGTGMASLAGLLAEAGHTVTGSDENVYPPMSDQLQKLGIRLCDGYKPDNLDTVKPELVIIGNVIRKENPEAQEVMRRGLHYSSMPEALHDFFLKNKTSIVISGTHGKTTSSTLAAWLFRSCDVDCGFMIGGIGQNLEKSYSLGKDNFFVVEGDEYDTAFFDKGPKFLHYAPSGLVITSIEFDHADIYKDLDGIKASFKKVVEIVPPDGVIVANADDANVLSVTSSAACRVVNYGLHSDAAYNPESVDVSERGTSFVLNPLGVRFDMPLWGEHNLSNAIGVLAMLAESGQDPSKLKEGLAKFKGVRRRQECVYDDKGICIIDDFAHHPTAVRRTIESMRERFPSRRIIAIFEPRSNTSRRNFFQEEYKDALGLADRVIIAKPYREDAIPEKERLCVDEIAASIMRRGKDAHAIHHIDHIVEYTVRGISPGDVVLVMSNGAFDGLCEKLIDAIGRRKIILDRSEITQGRIPR
jgi:UDP-N-acetylmuramate: L-alanyl-gamma-D-glutamyl-meso-diaminopimelate ligase